MLLRLSGMKSLYRIINYTKPGMKRIETINFVLKIELALSSNKQLAPPRGRWSGDLRNTRECFNQAMICYPACSSQNKIRLTYYCKPLFYMARLERFELPTARFVAEYSIQLSYRRLI